MAAGTLYQVCPCLWAEISNCYEFCGVKSMHTWMSRWILAVDRMSY